MPYLSNLLIAPLSLRTVLATRVAFSMQSTTVTVPNGCPALGLHVQHVMRLGAKPQVGGIYARWIVPAGAVVQYLKSFWDWAKVNLPRHAMGQQCLARLAAAARQFAVSKFSRPPLPYPARCFGSLLYVFPKQLGQWGWFKSTIVIAKPASTFFDFIGPRPKISSASFTNTRDGRMAGH